mgnify:CR=1 FL=1
MNGIGFLLPDSSSFTNLRNDVNSWGKPSLLDCVLRKLKMQNCLRKENVCLLKGRNANYFCSNNKKHSNGASKLSIMALRCKKGVEIGGGELECISSTKGFYVQFIQSFVRRYQTNVKRIIYNDNDDGHRCYQCNIVWTIGRFLFFWKILHTRTC